LEEKLRERERRELKREKKKWYCGVKKNVRHHAVSVSLKSVVTSIIIITSCYYLIKDRNFKSLTWIKISIRN